MPEGFGKQQLGSSVQACPAEQTQPVQGHWIEIELVGEDDRPVAWEAYLVTLPDGSCAPGFLDGEGFARLSGLEDAAPCQLSFPQLDRAAHTFLEALPARPAAETSAALTRVAALLPAEVSHTVMRGENLESIAFLYGHISETLWQHSSNAALKAQRNDPNILFPGDVVFVPALRVSSHKVATAQRHRFRRKGVPSMLRFRALVANQILAKQPYIVDIEGDKQQGTTDADGMLQCFVRPDAPLAVIRIGTEPLLWTFEVSLRTIDPIEEISGIQRRLANLGYSLPEISGTLDAPTQQALLAFQGNEGLQQNGQPDQPTRARLLAAHGS